MMETRIAYESDLENILGLQERNLVTRLTADEKKNGFVTTPFTGEQLVTLIELNGLFVLADRDSIFGYTMAAGWDYFKGRPMFDYMIERFQKIEYRGILVSRENSFQYGPICIDSTLRGSGAFIRLFEFMKAHMGARYPVGATFINAVNTRSFEAHTRKAMLEVIDEFEFNGNRYYGLAFLTRRRP